MTVTRFEWDDLAERLAQTADEVWAALDTPKRDLYRAMAEVACEHCEQDDEFLEGVHADCFDDDDLERAEAAAHAKGFLEARDRVLRGLALLTGAASRLQLDERTITELRKRVLEMGVEEDEG